VKFDFYPLRFEFSAQEPLFFPRGKAGNILRGAMGLHFRRVACVADCHDAKSCDLRHSCPYAKVFEPTSISTKITPSPSGLADWPRPFVFRARQLDGCTVAVGQPFHFDLHVFTPERDVLGYFVATFAALAREGLGPRRGKAELLRVRRLSGGGVPEQTLYERSVQMTIAAVQPVSFDLTSRPDAPTRIRVDFLSPTELKHEHRIAGRPEFPILFGRIRDRISTLSRLYGAGPLDIDYTGTNARAQSVQMTSCHLRRQETERRSTRTGLAHSIGGFLGTAEYEGDLAEFVPWLEAGRWTGVGRQSVWGKGEIQLSSRESHCPPGIQELTEPERAIEVLSSLPERSGQLRAPQDEP
jgi:hypothetical protein